jgi:polar amino acid transport system substrate-binding protein
MPSRSFMRKIQRRGYLIAGVNQNYLFFGYYDTAAKQEEGIEIDLLHQIAKAIFGNPNKITFKALNVPQRIPFVQDQQVDIVADAITITPKNCGQVDFSTVYYDAHQRVLVPSNSAARYASASSTGSMLSDLAGKRVCATAKSVPYDYIRDHSRAIPYGDQSATDCLVDLQEGKVDAISTDDAILLGLKYQDRQTDIVGPSLADAPYGMAINKAHPEFVRFVNAVLEQLRVDGKWKTIYHNDLGRYVSASTPAPPTPHYLP